MIASYLISQIYKSQDTHVYSKCGSICTTLLKSNYVSYRVPQSSNLGPLLFILFLNDIPQYNDKIKIIHANNTTAISSGKTSETVNLNVNHGMLKIISQLQLKERERNYIDEHKPFTQFFHDIHINSNLTWSKHINQVEEKCLVHFDKKSWSVKTYKLKIKIKSVADILVS